MKGFFKNGLLFLGFLILALVWEIHAQPTASLRHRPIILTTDTLVANGLVISDHVEFYSDPLSRLSLPQIRRQPFKPYSPDSIARVESVRSTLWLRFEVENQRPGDTARLVFFAGRLAFLTLVAEDSLGNETGRASGGTFAAWPARAVAHDGYGLPFKLPPGEKRTVFVSIKPDFFFKTGLKTIVLFEKTAYSTYKNAAFEDKKWLLAFYAFTFGCLFFGAVFTLLQYGSRRDAALIFYVGVVLFSLLRIVRVVEYSLELRTLSALTPMFIAYLHSMSLGNIFFYVIFTQQILNLKQNDPRFYRATRLLLLIYGICFPISLWLPSHFVADSAVLAFASYRISALVSLLILFSGVLLVGMAFYRKIPMSGYLLSAIALFTVGHVVYVILNLTTDADGTGPFQFWMVPSVYMCLGLIGEMFGFSLALGERAHRSEREKTILAEKKRNLEDKVAERTRELQKALSEAQEALLKGQTLERKRVASELHDNLGGTIAAVKFTLQRIDSKSLSAPEQVIYEQLQQMVGEAGQQLRYLSHNLLPDALEGGGLVEALKSLVRKLNHTGKVQFELLADPALPRLDKQAEFNLYVICLELCTNCLKHSGATRATLELRREGDQLHLTVDDNGRGFDLTQTSAGMGLSNLYDRASSLSAVTQITSSPEGGTRTSLRVPMG